MEALDGNAVAGPLFEYFGTEMTGARGACAYCGTPAHIAELRVYVVARRWGGRFWTATATLIVERVLDSLCIVLILGALILLVPHRMPGYVEATAVVMLLPPFAR